MPIQRSSIFLSKIYVTNLKGCSESYMFSSDRKNYTVNEVCVNSEEEADMWSALIEILNCIACCAQIPYMDEDWQIVIVYERWDNPIVFFDNPSEIIKVVISCKDGILTENAYEITSTAIPVPPDNDSNLKIVGKSNLPKVIIDDFYYFNLYRWNPRYNEDRVLSDDKDYFLSMHDKWCRQDRELYEQEMNAVMQHMFPENFESLEAVNHKYEMDSTNPSKFTYLIYDKYTGNGTIITNCDDHIQNFFYSYVEFKKYKDFESGMFGLFLTDCYSSVYINLFKKMISGCNSDKNSQILFIRWSDDILEEKNKSKFASRMLNT